MKNYFRFEFFGWIKKMSLSKTKNGISFIRIQVVNGKDFIFLHCFEDFTCVYEDIQEGDGIKVEGDICKKRNSIDYYFKPSKISCINSKSKVDDEPSSDEDIKEIIESCSYENQK